MTFFVERQYREILCFDSEVPKVTKHYSIQELNDCPAFVLLGPPGSGKTTIFKREVKRQDGTYVTIRDFLARDQTGKNEPIFIDGLDEQRVRSTDPITLFDQLRAKLEELNYPKFRISCREADWLGSNDTENLKKVSPNKEIRVLQLLPLKNSEIDKILAEELGKEKAKEFIRNAKENGVHGLLSNPQILEFLVKSVGNRETWPKNRLETFEMACKSLLSEHNEEHQYSRRYYTDLESLMDASGKFCSILLLTGSTGITWKNNLVENFINLQEVHSNENVKNIFNQSLQSKLFLSQQQEQGNLEPIHRQVAEYLAARYLAKLIKQDLPTGRILALMTGYDGKVVTELRGLSAWLASHCKSSRGDIIEKDPLGTVLYGDIANFSPVEKKQLLAKLQEETKTNPDLIKTLQFDTRFGDLVTPELKGDLIDYLSSLETEQSFLFMLLLGLKHGDPLSDISEFLFNLICNDRWWISIRILAIDAFIRHVGERKSCATLKELCKGLIAGKIIDQNDRLLGRILSILYPKEISELEILEFLKIPYESDHLLEYENFWLRKLPNKSIPNQIGIILDKLVDRLKHVSPKRKSEGIARFGFRCLTTNLVEKFLQNSESKVDSVRLFHWLGATLSANDFNYSHRVANSEIHNWLKNHPEVWKTLYNLSLLDCRTPGISDPSDLTYCMFNEIRGRLFNFIPPPDFRQWCLDQAKLSEHMVVAKWYLQKTIADMNQDYGQPLTQETVINALREKDDLLRLFKDILSEIEDLKNQANSHLETSKVLDEGNYPNWHEQVKPFEEEIRQNRGDPFLLQKLSQVYFGRYSDLKGKNPKERLVKILGMDEDLVKAVFSGFRGTLKRDDLPTKEEILNLYLKNKHHPLSIPLLAGIEEISNTDISFMFDLDDRVIELLVVIFYTARINNYYQKEGLEYPPIWLKWILNNLPEVVADAFVNFSLANLQTKGLYPYGLYELVDSKDYEKVANIASLKLLKRFPVRCTSSNLTYLERLFLVVRKHNQSNELLKLVKKKLTLKSMNVEQRVYWLAAGLCIDPNSYLDQFDSKKFGDERRIRFLANAVCDDFFYFERNLPNELVVEAQNRIIKLIGSSFYPISIDEGFNRPGHQDFVVSDRIIGLINDLSSIPHELSTQALMDLKSDEKLGPWSKYLVEALNHQKINRRNNSFRFGSVAEVQNTLNNREPTNSADLAALTFEFLTEIKENIRHSNTSDWRQYWKLDGDRPINPQWEDICRNALLSDLQIYLQSLDLEGLPEGRYVNDKRADIRVSNSKFNIPIEIKKSYHRDLWTSINEQLIAKYTRDPGANGYGIYLVFWFGNTDEYKPHRSPAGLKPTSPEQLEEELISSLTPEQKLKIRICVIDVSNQKAG